VFLNSLQYIFYSFGGSAGLPSTNHCFCGFGYIRLWESQG